MNPETHVRCKPACHYKVPKLVRGRMVERLCQKPVVVARRGYLWCVAHNPERDLAAERERREINAYRSWKKRWLS